MVSSEEEYDSDEDPVPDDEDREDEKQYPMVKQIHHNTKGKSKQSPKIKKQKKFRSTSHNKHLKNKKFGRIKGAFNYRKASNRPYLKEALTPQNVPDSYHFSRNHPTNLSHAQTHHSPKDYKSLGMIEPDYDDEVESYHTNISHNYLMGQLRNKMPPNPRLRTRNPNIQSNLSLHPGYKHAFSNLFSKNMRPPMQYQTHDHMNYPEYISEYDQYDMHFMAEQLEELEKEKFIVMRKKIQVEETMKQYLSLKIELDKDKVIVDQKTKEFEYLYQHILEEQQRLDSERNSFEEEKEQVQDMRDEIERLRHDNQRLTQDNLKLASQK